MIGIDTNVLLRLWLNDDPAQNTHIDALLTTHGGMPGSWLVTDVVLAEAGRREPCPTRLRLHRDVRSRRAQAAGGQGALI
jgi:predicted nucleic acid-binding protein